MPAEIAPKVLVVDDDHTVARSLARLLLREGFEVQVATSFREAQKIRGTFDVAVVDLDLGDGSGLDLGVDLLGRRVVQRVCFFSGASDPELERRAREVGLFVRKGVEARELIQLLTRAASEGRTGATEPNRRSVGRRAPRTLSGTRRRTPPLGKDGEKIPAERKTRRPRSA